MKQLIKEVEILTNNLETKVTYRNELQKQLDQIINSKFFSIWQKFAQLKKFININTYINYVRLNVKKYKYSLSDFETPHHDFIILKTKTDKWKIDGYEKVGEDWHIVLIRTSDNKKFLLDQPFFYYLQIYKNFKFDLQKEMFITYGITKENLEKIKLIVMKLKL